MYRDDLINALADKVHKQGVPHVICMCTPTLFNNHPYFVSQCNLQVILDFFLEIFLWQCNNSCTQLLLVA